MDTAQWPQGIVVKPIEEIVTNTCPKPSSNSAAANDLERKLVRPHKEAALNCPRCNSTNTKFCYYNNYSLTQPRYFCKTCRRYWTDGGSLRNIPVGGGSRKNKRSSSSSSNSTTTSSNLSNNNSKRLPDLIQSQQGNSQGQDLNLGFPSSQVFPHHHQIPNIDQNSDKNHNSSSTSTTTTTTTTTHLSALELLTGLTSRGLNSFMPMPLLPNSSDPSNQYTSGFPMSELMIKPTLNFSLEGLGSGYGTAIQGHHHVQENSGRLLFPFEDLKQVSGSDGMDHHQQNDKELHHGGDSTGYWTGMLGGGSW